MLKCFPDSGTKLHPGLNLDISSKINLAHTTFDFISFFIFSLFFSQMFPIWYFDVICALLKWGLYEFAIYFFLINHALLKLCISACYLTLWILITLSRRAVLHFYLAQCKQDLLMATTLELHTLLQNKWVR